MYQGRQKQMKCRVTMAQLDCDDSGL